MSCALMPCCWWACNFQGSAFLGQPLAYIPPSIDVDALVDAVIDIIANELAATLYTHVYEEKIAMFEQIGGFSTDVSIQARNKLLKKLHIANGHVRKRLCHIRRLKNQTQYARTSRRRKKELAGKK